MLELEIRWVLVHAPSGSGSGSEDEAEAEAEAAAAAAAAATSACVVSSGVVPSGVVSPSACLFPHLLSADPSAAYWVWELEARERKSKGLG